MLKLTGCVLILIAGIGFGVSNSFYMKKQLEQLISFQETLYWIAGETKHFHRPLPEVFALLAKEKGGVYKKVFAMIEKRLLECKYALGSEVWQKSFLEYQKEFICTREEFDVLLKSGCFLDAKEFKTQEKELTFYEMQIGRMIEKRQRELKEKQRIGMYASVLTGVFFMILLL